jgi:hypothetical protein
MAMDRGWLSAANGEPGAAVRAPVAVLMANTDTELEF